VVCGWEGGGGWIPTSALICKGQYHKNFSTGVVGTGLVIDQYMYMNISANFRNSPINDPKLGSRNALFCREKSDIVKFDT